MSSTIQSLSLLLLTAAAWFPPAIAPGIAAPATRPAAFTGTGGATTPENALGKAETVAWESLVRLPRTELPTWGWLPPERETSSPDFELSEAATRGGGGKAAEMRQAVVILGASEGGFGSGVLISPHGWVLTNYHVVASEAQASAITGEPARLRVLLGELSEGRMRLRQEALTGVVFRGDPVHDLALLKIEGSLPRMTGVRLAKKSVEAGSDCYVIGSQGSGFPWLLRSGKILGQFEYPFDITDVLVSADSTGVSFERARISTLVSDCPISPGDSGGPLINKDGELIGLTFGTPANLSAGSMGMHVDREEIQKFLSEIPETPEPIPFDPWVAGLPFAAMAQPRAGIVRDDGKPFFVLQRLHLGPIHQPIAELLFFDFDARSHVEIAGGDTLMSLLPMGLWGMEGRGKFLYDVFLARRYDNVVAVGFPDGSGITSEIRIDSDGDQSSEVVWNRAPDGSWTCRAETLPLVDSRRLSARGVRLLGQALAPPPEE